MFKDFVMQDEGIEIMPLISLCFFVIFFTALIIRVFMYTKNQINELSNIPLNDNFLSLENEKELTNTNQ